MLEEGGPERRDLELQFIERISTAMEMRETARRYEKEANQQLARTFMEGHNEGLSYTEMATWAGMTKQSVNHIIKNYGGEHDGTRVDS